MARALDIGARLPRGRATPHPILPAIPSAHTPDPYGLTHAEELRIARRALDDAYTTWGQCEPEYERVCWARVQEADARMQALVTRAQREMGGSAS